MLLFLTEIVFQFGVLLICARYGGRAVRQTALWYLLDAVIQWLLLGYERGTVTLHLVIDGIYAMSLIPMAFYYVSWWIGIMAIISCGNFSLQSAYLLTDMPTDYRYLAISNGAAIASLLTMLGATIANQISQRRRQRRTPPSPTELAAA